MAPIAVRFFMLPWKHTFVDLSLVPSCRSMRSCWLWNRLSVLLLPCRAPRLRLNCVRPVQCTLCTSSVRGSKVQYNVALAGEEFALALGKWESPSSPWIGLCVCVKQELRVISHGQSNLSVLSVSARCLTFFLSFFLFLLVLSLCCFPSDSKLKEKICVSHTS